MLTLDTYNGSRAAAESYRQITGVTAPMLQNASNGTDYAGARLEDILVVDQTGIVRYWTNATSDVDYPRINQMVDALVESEQAIFPFYSKTVKPALCGICEEKPFEANTTASNWLKFLLPMPFGLPGLPSGKTQVFIDLQAQLGPLILATQILYQKIGHSLLEMLDLFVILNVEI